MNVGDFTRLFVFISSTFAGWFLLFHLMFEVYLLFNKLDGEEGGNESKCGELHEDNDALAILEGGISHRNYLFLVIVI